MGRNVDCVLSPSQIFQLLCIQKALAHPPCLWHKNPDREHACMSCRCFVIVLEKRTYASKVIVDEVAAPC